MTCPKCSSVLVDHIDVTNEGCSPALRCLICGFRYLRDIFRQTAKNEEVKRKALRDENVGRIEDLMRLLKRYDSVLECARAIGIHDSTLYTYIRRHNPISVQVAARIERMLENSDQETGCGT